MQNEKDISPIEKELRAKLDGLRRKENAVRQAEGSLRFFLIIAGAWLVLSLMESVLHTPPIVRTIGMLLLVATVAAATGRYLVVPLLRRIGVAVGSSTDLELAGLIGQRHPRVRDHLANGLQIVEESRVHTARYSRSLIGAVLHDVAGELNTIDVLSVVDYSIPMRLVRYCAGTIAVYLLLFIIVPVTLHDTAYRLLHFSESFAAPAPFTFDVTPGDAEVVKGGNLDVTIHLRGEQKKEIEFMTQTLGQAPVEEVVLRRDSSGAFVWHSPILKNSFLYYADAGGIRSTSFMVKVIDRPVIKNLSVRLIPPAYTGLREQKLDDNTGDITALRGTRVTVSLMANKDIGKAFIVFADSTRVEMQCKGADVNGTFIVKNDNQYHFELQDPGHIRNVDPIAYAVHALPDQPPEIAIVVPGRNIDLNDQMQIPLLMTLRDDFGFSKLRLYYRLSQSKYEKPQEQYTAVDIPLPATKAPGREETVELSVSYQWDLTPLNLAAEDIVTYYAEAADNNFATGPSVARSREFTIRYPSLDEVFSDVDREHQTSTKDLQENLKQAEELHKSLDEISRDLKKNPQIDWQQQKKLEETMKRYQDLQKDIRTTAQKVDSMLQSVQNKNVLSPETMQKYMELQQLLQQIDSPELNAALRRMQEAMKQLSPDQIRQAMQQLSMSEENLRKSIERTVSLLKRIQVEQKFDEAIRRTEELRQSEAELRKQSATTPPDDAGRKDQLSQKQEDAQKEFQQLQKQLADLQKRMEEFPDEMPLREYAETMDFLEKQNVDASMEQSADDIQQGRMHQAQAQQQRAEGSLREFGKQLQHTKDVMQQQMQERLLSEFRKVMSGLLTMSEKEENLKNESRTLDPSSQRFRENAQEQVQVMDDLGKLANSLNEAARKSFVVTPKMGSSMGQAYGEMSSALQALEDRNGQQASDRQQKAMASLNDATRQIQQAMDDAMQGGQGGLGSLLQQLGRMALQQQGINGQTMDLNSGQGLTPEQAAQAARLAAEQSALQKSLEQLNKEASESAERQKLLGDLDKISSEMQEVVSDLEQHDVNPNTIQRQERILSRLLDASRSMRERDYENRRRAEVGKDSQQASPTELDPSVVSGTSRLMQDLQKALEQGYAKEYQDLIRKYFEELQKTK